MPEASKEQIEAIVVNILDSHNVNYYVRNNDRVSLFFCAYKGINFNIKIKSNCDVEAWTYSDKPVPPGMRFFVLEILNAYAASNHDIQAYVDEGDRIIFRRSFSGLERDSISDQAISTNMDIFFKNTICHKHLNPKFTKD